MLSSLSILVAFHRILCMVMKYSVNWLCLVIGRNKLIDIDEEVPCISFGEKNLPNYSFTEAYTEDVKEKAIFTEMLDTCLCMLYIPRNIKSTDIGFRGGTT